MLNSKVCSGCKEEKPSSEFNKKGNGLQPYCRPCDNARSRERYRANPESHKRAVLNRNREYRRAAKAYINELKESTPCADCGKFYPYYIMDFDHQRDKKRNIATMTGNRLKTIKEEIAKCEIVCANCHRERTFGNSSVV